MGVKYEIIIVAVHSHLQYVNGILKWNSSDSCKSTALKDRATGEKGPVTELKLGTYALLRSFSHMSHRSQSRSFVPNHPLVPVTGVLLSNGCLRLAPRGCYHHTARSTSLEAWRMWDISYVNRLCKQCGFVKVNISSIFYPFSPVYCVQRAHVWHESEPLFFYYDSIFKAHGQRFAGSKNIHNNGKIAVIVDVANGSEA